MPRNAPRLDIAILLASVLLAACSKTSYTRTGTPGATRGAGCTFAVLTTVPQTPFREIGVVEFYTPGGGTAGYADSVDEARQRSAQFVCAEGGDGLLLQGNDRGYFTRATIISTAAR